MLMSYSIDTYIHVTPPIKIKTEQELTISVFISSIHNLINLTKGVPKQGSKYNNIYLVVLVSGMYMIRRINILYLN